MILGMDFGTTNSGLAIDDGQVRLLPLDPANPTNPHVVRTMIYINRQHRSFIGREALRQYVEGNQGRPVRLKQEYVGTLCLTFAEVGTFYRDAHIWVDELEPGRLFRSIKSHLQDQDYIGTSVWGQYYRLEDLIALFLRTTKERAEKHLGREVREIVLGRPVVFSTDPAADRLAEERLARAAILAGYERAYLQLEPIGAALAYHETLDRPQRVLVFDFGGGTLDIAVMQVDGRGGHQVLATGGVRIAGDVFDQRIVRGRLARQLGENAVYGPKRLRMPVYIYEDLAEWQTLLLLNRPHELKFLAEVEPQSSNPAQIRNLLSLIRNNYGQMMFDRVERAKIALSSEDKAVIRLAGQGLDIQDPFSRGEFERLIGPEARHIAACVDETMARAGIEPVGIDAVIRTGGSSLIPLFQRMLEEKFGRDKVRPLDEFSSVTTGLAVTARLLEQGRVELRSYDQSILTSGQLIAQVQEERTR